jgi:ArsR family transcriptional regulator
MEEYSGKISIVDVFSALSDKTRINIAKELLNGERACSEIFLKYKLSKSTFSHHAKVLAKSGIIKLRREGKFLYFSLNKEVLESSFALMLKKDYRED